MTTLQLSGETHWRSLGVGHRAVVDLLRDAGLHREAQEVFVVIPIRADLATPGVIEIHRGDFDRAALSLAPILAAVITAGCDRFIVAHNHPADDERASIDDARMVQRLAYAADALDLTFLNAYIITPSGHWSAVNE